MLIALALLQTAVPSLELTCTGNGIATREEVATVYGAENSGNSAWPTMHARTTARFAERVTLRVANGESHIRLPEAMLPAGHGSDSWFALGNLEIAGESITGFAAVNPLSRPRVHLDRKTGAIRIDGRSASYSGICGTARS